MFRLQKFNFAATSQHKTAWCVQAVQLNILLCTHQCFYCCRLAVQCCPEDEEDNFMLSSEEKQSLLNAKQNQIRHLVGKYSLFCMQTISSRVSSTRCDCCSLFLTDLESDVEGNFLAPWKHDGCIAWLYSSLNNHDFLTIFRESGVVNGAKV